MDFHCVKSLPLWQGPFCNKCGKKRNGLKLSTNYKAVTEWKFDKVKFRSKIKIYSSVLSYCKKRTLENDKVQFLRLSSAEKRWFRQKKKKQLWEEKSGSDRKPVLNRTEPNWQKNYFRRWFYEPNHTRNLVQFGFVHEPCTPLALRILCVVQTGMNWNQ